MPPRLNQKHTSEIEIKILDEISDGQWHPITKITKRFTGKKTFSTDEVTTAVEELSAKGYLLAGANSSYRLPEKYVRQWRNIRDLPLETKDSRSPRFFGGVLEDDGWLKAPLIAYNLLHFRANSHITSRMIQDRIGELGAVNQDEDGLFRIFSKLGDETYYMLKEWNTEDPNVGITGLRLTYNTYRRDLTALPAGYLDELCKFYGSFAFILLRNNMSSIKKHIPEHEDIQQQIYIWVMDAVARYDDSTCIPFAAYLHTVLQRWVHNLNRKSHGRAAADNELKHSRAIALFEAQNGRTPTIAELAESLGETVKKVAQDSVSIKMVSNLRSTTTLDSDDFTVPLVAKESTDESVEVELEKTLLSAALFSTALEQDAETRGASLSALFSIIDKTWNKNKSLAGLYKGQKQADLINYEEMLMKEAGKKIRQAYAV